MGNFDWSIYAGVLKVALLIIFLILISTIKYE